MEKTMITTNAEGTIPETEINSLKVNVEVDRFSPY